MNNGEELETKKKKKCFVLKGSWTGIADYFVFFIYLMPELKVPYIYISRPVPTLTGKLRGNQYLGFRGPWKMTVSPPSVVAAAKSGRVLIVGATGFIGLFIAEASLAARRPTYLLVRSPEFCSSKPSNTIKALQEKGAVIVHGVINDQDLMEKTLRENKIEIVISAVGGANILDQLTLIRAIKAVGTIKRFLPSEFGHDVDRADPVEPGLKMYNEKRRVRRLIEEMGLAYTYICCNSIASWPYYDNTHPSEVIPPLDEFQIYGDGSVKAYFVAGSDIGKYTMKAVDDNRTLNKSVHFRPACNFLNINELASLWETKIGRQLPRVTVTEHDLLAAAAENIIPQSIVASFTHDIFIRGCQVNFPVDGPNEVEVSSLYPDETFRTVDECFDDYVVQMENKSSSGNTDNGGGAITAGDGANAIIGGAATDGIAAQNHVVEVLPITPMCA